MVQQRYGSKKRRNFGMQKKLAILGVGSMLFLLAVAGVLFLIYKGLSRSDFFQITATNIQGCRRTTKNLILEVSGVDVHSNLLALNLGAVREKIEAHEWVDSAEVKRVWPNRLNITIKERVPVALASLEEGLFYVDQSGVAFAQMLPPEDMDYPVITGLSREAWPQTLSGSVLEDALQFIRQAGQGNSILPKQNISELRVDENGVVLFLVDRPFPIRLGRGAVATKYYWLAKVLYRLYKGKEFAKTAYIDMEYGRNKVLVGFDGPV